METPTARLTVDLDALAANYRTIAAEAAGAEVAPVVKADAYGLGLGPVALRLHTEGARAFYVARVEGGETLRALLGRRAATLYVLDGVAPGTADRFRASALTPVLNDMAELDAWRAPPGQPPSPAALHVDTGLNRLGLRPEQAASLAADPASTAGLSIELLVSHLACGSESAHGLNAVQRARFAEVRRLFPTARASFANSAGAFLGPEHRFDQVRPGISLYGVGPFDRPDPRIRPVVTLEAPILQVRDVPAGESVGYGAVYSAERDMRVATVGVGYADGVLRSASPAGAVWFEGGRRPLVGRVSMDLLAIDVTGCDTARPGALVQLFGPDLPIEDAAAAAGSIPYELLVRLGPRVRRVYRGRT